MFKTSIKEATENGFKISIKNDFCSPTHLPHLIHHANKLSAAKGMLCVNFTLSRLKTCHYVMEKSHIPENLVFSNVIQ